MSIIFNLKIIRIRLFIIVYVRLTGDTFKKRNVQVTKFKKKGRSEIDVHNF